MFNMPDKRHSIKTTTRATLVKLLPFFLFYVLLTWIVSGNIFFWDTIQLGAKHGLFFFDNNFSSFILPDEIDSGHIPAFGAYLALMWKVFGKSLIISHFAMLPFLLGIVWQAFNLLRRYINEKYIYLGLILFLADTTLLAQSTLVSPDVVLVFLFLYGLNSVLNNHKLHLSIAIFGLFLISMRGMMTALALLVIDLIINIKYEDLKSTFKKLVSRSLIYFPALVLFLAFNIYHYKSKGWIGYHTDSPWASSFEIVGLKGFLYNSGILIWRLIDFGRVFLWITGLIIFFRYINSLKQDRKLRILLLVFISVTICLSLSLLLYKNLNGHRYLLPVYLSFSLIVIYLIFEKLKSDKIKYIVFSLLLIGILSGNLWIYPDKISKGWDSTLAHLSYYPLRKQMQNYLQKQGISIEDVGSAFPNLAEQRYLELNNDIRKHPEKNLNQDKYILYSNVYNDFTDEEIDRLASEFVILKEYRQGRIKLILYKKP